MPAPLALVACANHVEREAIGICVKCRKRICGECTTKLDGINHCVTCFEAVAAENARPAKAARREGPLAAAVSAAVLFSIAVALAWGALELGLLGLG